jgi:hypothetical protein
VCATLSKVLAANGIVRAFLAAAVAACGARSELLVDQLGTEQGAPGPATPRIVFFGTAGTYDEDALLAFLQAYPATVTRLGTNASPVTADSLAAFDIVILDQLTRSFDGSEATALAAWVHGGGSVMSLTGFVNTDSDWSWPNSLLAGLPLQYVSGLVIDTPSPSSVTDFASHPVTAGLHEVPFWGGYRVTLTGNCDGATQTVAFVPAGPVGAVCEHGSGRAYLWGDEWVEYSSEWTPATDAQQFWQDAIDWLARRD